MAKELERYLNDLDGNDITDTGVPGEIKRGYNKMLTDALDFGWKKIMAAAGSGFGKGAILTGLGVIASVTLKDAVLADEGKMMVKIPTDDGLGLQEVPGNINHGLWAGLNDGASTLLHPLGYGAVAAGGAVGAMAEIKSRQTQHQAEVAETRALVRAQMRENAPTPALDASTCPNADMTQQDMNCCNPVAEKAAKGKYELKELQRRNLKAAAQSLGRMGYA